MCDEWLTGRLAVGFLHLSLDYDWKHSHFHITSIYVPDMAAANKSKINIEYYAHHGNALMLLLHENEEEWREKSAHTHPVEINK